jgi:hypothetical protein
MYRSLLIIIIVPTPCTVSTREKFWLTRDSKRHTINMKTDYSSLGREPIFLLEKFSDVLFFTENMFGNAVQTAFSKNSIFFFFAKI